MHALIRRGIIGPYEKNPCRNADMRRLKNHRREKRLRLTPVAAHFSSLHRLNHGGEISTLPWALAAIL
jgi:hypothetical protein